MGNLGHIVSVIPYHIVEYGVYDEASGFSKGKKKELVPTSCLWPATGSDLGCKALSTVLQLSAVFLLVPS